MFRKIAGALALVLGLALFTGSATAQDMSAVHGRMVSLKFRVSISGVNSQGYQDSVLSTSATVWPNLANLDTTTSFSTAGLVPQPPSGTAGSDSSVACRLILSADAATNLVAGTDSMFVIPQVSGDGTSWATANLVKDAAHANTFGAAASILTQFIPATTQVDKSATVLFHQAISGRQFPDVNSLLSWPYIRFIIAHGSGASTKLASYRAQVMVWSASSTRND